MKKYFFVFLLIFMVGCAAKTELTPEVPSITPIATSSPTPEVLTTPQSTAINDLRPFIESREIVLMTFDVAKNDLGTAGELFEINIQNGSKTPRLVEIPCGTTFLPKQSDQYQNFVTIQPTNFTLEPMGWIILHPMVVCVEPEKETPFFGERYTVGGLAEGNILGLAQCVCKTAIDPTDTTTLLSTQVSFWFLSEGVTSQDLDKISDEGLLEILEQKNISAETMSVVNSYLPFLRSAVKTRLSECGY